MNWYEPLEKTAKEIGHGDTLDGQFIELEFKRICKEINKLKTAAISGSIDVLPRWKGEIKNKIYLLPSINTIKRMSMYELKTTAKYIDFIKDMIKHYSASKFKKIMGG